MSGFWRLTVTGEFSAGHALRGYCGKCEKMHGHNFSVEINVEGSELDAKTGILLDFKILKNLLKDALSRLDHCLLNEVAPFDHINPSSENLAREIYGQMRILLQGCQDPQAKKVRISSVSVAEKDGQMATYFPD